MSKYVLQRLLQGILALFLASIIVFALGRMTGNPAYLMIGEDSGLEEIATLTKHLGLDKPLVQQYWIFLSNAIRGDFGNSLRYRTPVISFIAETAPATFKLTGLAAVISLVIALPFGVLGAIKRNRWVDTLGKAFAIFGQSAPTFWVGILLIEIFSVKLGWFPAGGSGNFQYLLLPAFAIGYHGTAGILRFTRSAMLDVLSTDYVRQARIKGVKEKFVIWKHALKNALIPVVTFLTMTFANWLMGTVAIETVFSWPGLGRLAYQSVMYRDFPMLQGLILFFVAIFVLLNLITDILYCYLDPRVRYVKE